MDNNMAKDMGGNDREFHIRQLDDGSYLLRICDYGNGGEPVNSKDEEYSYDNVDDMLTDIKNDIGEKDSKDDNVEESPQKKKVKELTSVENE